jgi:UDP-GlcNAc:undecaprenyl-phosphate GlcNAc-1-phosphate transferase
MDYIIPFYLEFFIVTLFIPFAIRFANYIGIVDHPGYRKIHSAPIPRIGGAVISISVITLFFLIGDKSSFLNAYVFSGILILIFGFIDDFITLSYRYKFLAQASSSIVFISLLKTYIPFTEVFIGHSGNYFQLFDILLTIIFIVGTINIINLVDGLDALASGLSIISIIFICYLGYYAGDANVITLSILLIGSILAFMRFNVFPATIFMGDTGSQFLGYTLGVCFVALFSSQSSNSYNLGMIPYLLGIPLIDTLNVIFVRLRGHKNPFLPDKNHIHHKLIALGFPQYKAVTCIYLFHFLILSIGLFLKPYDSQNILFGYILLLLSIMYILSFNFNSMSISLKRSSYFKFFIGKIYDVLGLPFVSRRFFSRMCWLSFLFFLGIYYIYFSLTMTNISLYSWSIIVSIMIFVSLLFIVYKFNFNSFAKIVFYFFNLLILIYSNENLLFGYKDCFLCFSFIDMAIVSIFFLYLFCIILTPEKIPINSIDLLLMISAIFLILFSGYDSKIIYYFRFSMKVILVSFFVNLIFSRFSRNYKYITFLACYMFSVLVLKSIVL